ncbi:uncharacterized protein B0H18DRAFT_1125513 [Fomitopsis serialis]|uniref:uncharacterized protein n=1 Tax=Fomitopsis serialis TaxID=139415 RepID=UPI002008B4E7|nr:uncharacterized protein B0H18DRAFT_1125513 [Neoantrodia serialis]KAH9914477.1 hypothetical protein B0H18DRAFT_1125513 [Neoantrodia serialis]
MHRIPEPLPARRLAVPPPTKPGHRKILVFFLVDPNMITIPSASTVAPKQELWIRWLWCRLLKAVHKMIWELLDPITERQARKYREELTNERTLAARAVDKTRFGQFFNLCEH